MESGTEKVLKKTEMTKYIVVKSCEYQSIQGSLNWSSPCENSAFIPSL